MYDTFAPVGTWTLPVANGTHAVVISGMVEARLERSDTLILAGLRDGVFPKKSTRPLFLASALRERLGLPGWPAALSRDAELFARLLHGAPQVLLTWSTEEAGSPALPSSFVSRLELVLQPELKSVDSRLWRVKPTPWDEIAAAEKTARLLRHNDHIIRLRVVTMEAEPRVVDFRGEELARHLAPQQPVAVLGKGRMIRDAVTQVEAAEPAIGQVQMNLFAEPPFRANTEAVAHQQHAD